MVGSGGGSVGGRSAHLVDASEVDHGHVVVGLVQVVLGLHAEGAGVMRDVVWGDEGFGMG